MSVTAIILFLADDSVVLLFLIVWSVERISVCRQTDRQRDRQAPGVCTWAAMDTLIKHGLQPLWCVWDGRVQQCGHRQWVLLQ